MNGSGRIGLQLSEDGSIVDNVTAPDDILDDPDLSKRVVFDTGVLRLVIALGRLTPYHGLLMPSRGAVYSESVGDFLAVTGAWPRFATALERAHRLVCSRLPKVSPVLFEHGGTDFAASERYGTRVAHMHVCWLQNVDSFAEALSSIVSPGNGWFRIAGWQELSDIATRKAEYLFVQAGEGEAWCRQRPPGADRASSQALREIVASALVQSGQRESREYQWRRLKDVPSAEVQTQELIAALRHQGDLATSVAVSSEMSL